MTVKRRTKWAIKASLNMTYSDWFKVQKTADLLDKLPL